MTSPLRIPVRVYYLWAKLLVDGCLICAVVTNNYKHCILHHFFCVRVCISASISVYSAVSSVHVGNKPYVSVNAVVTLAILITE